MAACGQGVKPVGILRRVPASLPPTSSAWGQACGEVSPCCGKGLCRQGHQWGNACVHGAQSPRKTSPRTLHLHALPACGWDAGNSPICGGQPAPFPRHAAFAHSLSHMARLQRPAMGLMMESAQVALHTSRTGRGKRRLSGTAETLPQAGSRRWQQRARGRSCVQVPHALPCALRQRLFPMDGRTHAPGCGKAVQSLWTAPMALPLLLKIGRPRGTPDHLVSRDSGKGAYCSISSIWKHSMTSPSLMSL